MIVDVKGELIDATYPAVSRHHQAVILNFVDPGVSVAYNPVAHVHGYMEAALLARAPAEARRSTPSGLPGIDARACRDVRRGTDGMQRILPRMVAG